MELEIKQDDELFDLETLITEGINSRVPIEIEFPNGKKAGALIRPISTAEFQTIYNGDVGDIMINVLEAALLNTDGESISKELIKAMPIGLPAKLMKQIFEISGIEEDEETAQKMNDNLKLFPQL